MKTTLTLLTAILLFIAGSSYGQLATYTGSGGTSTAVTGYANETVSILQDVGFGGNTPCGSGGLSGKTVNTAWGSYSTTGPHYYIKITPNAGYQLNMTGMDVGLRRSNTGPTAARFAYSLDNGVTWIDDATNHPNTSTSCGVSSPNASWGVGALPTGISNTGNGIIVAVFPFAASNSAGTFQTNYINISGSVTVGCIVPTITVTPTSASICSGGSGTSLTATGAGAGGTYTWAPLAGLSATTGATVTANPATTTVYTVTGYSGACSNTSTVTITVNPPASAGTILGADSVCAGSSIVLTDPTASTGGTWSWTTSAPSVATVIGGVVHGVSQGTATIVYSVTTTCGSASTSHNVTVNPLPNAGTITGLDSVCYGTSISLTDPATGGTWNSSLPSVATVSSSGVVTGLVNALTNVNITFVSTTFSCGTATATHPVTVKPQPNAGVITGNNTVCKLDVTTLTNVASGGVWISGNNSVATVTSNGHVFGASAGNSIITYSVTNSCGNAMDTMMVQVNELPPAIGGSTSICVGISTTLTDSLPSGLWSSNNLPVATVDAAGNVYGVSQGTATITYSNSLTHCYVTTLVSVNLSVPPSISIVPSTPTSVCAGTPVTFTANPVNGGTSPLFVWSINGLILAGGPAYSYTPNDGDLVRCWFISSLSCAVPDTASAIVTMTVHHIATPELSITTGTGDTVCQGVVTTLTAVPVDGGSAPVFHWFVNLMPAGTGSTLSYVPANGDLVKCTLLSNAFCRTADTASTSKILTVSPFIDPVVNMFSDPGPTICDGYPVSFSSSQTGGGTAPTYQWAVNGTPASTGTSFSYIPSNGDTVQITLTSNFPCVTSSTAVSSMPITVVPVIMPVGVVNARPGTIVRPGSIDTFDVTVLSGGGLSPTFQWNINSAPIAGATNTVFITGGLHTGDSVNCVVVNNDLCSGIATFNSVHITVGSNVGIQNLSNGANHLSLFPDPNIGSFTINANFSNGSDEAVTCEILDVIGRVWHRETIIPQNGVLAKQIYLGDSIAPGQHILRLVSGNDMQYIHFVVNR